MTNPARAYLATQVETTTQGELLIMLYEAAIKFLKRAKIEIDNKDYAKKGIYISKAMAIIHELAESLNKEKGGDITPRLNQLYMFCTSQLIKANIRLDNKMIDDVIRILDGLRSAYAQIVPGHDGKPAQGQAAAGPGALPRVPGMGRAMPKAPPMYPAAPAYQPASAPASAPAPATGQAQPAALGETEPPAAAQPVQSGEDSAPSQARNETPESKPEPPRQPEPPKVRTAFNAAKFRAANAYSNNNR